MGHSPFLYQQRCLKFSLLIESVARAGSLRTIYITHKPAYELFLVFKAMAINLVQIWQDGVSALILLEFNFRAFLLPSRLILAAIGQRVLSNTSALAYFP